MLFIPFLFDLQKVQIKQGYLIAEAWEEAVLTWRTSHILGFVFFFFFEVLNWKMIRLGSFLTQSQPSMPLILGMILGLRDTM